MERKSSLKKRKRRSIQNGNQKFKRGKHFVKDEEHSSSKTSLNFSSIKSNSSEDIYSKEGETSLKSEIVYEHVYFEKILETLKDGIPDDSKDLFIVNALEESRGKEIELSCHSQSSHCLELLLSQCKDSNVWMQFMSAFLQDKITVLVNPNASHLVELLTRYSIEKLKDISNLESQDSECERKETFFQSWVVELGEFLTENFIGCLENQYAAHVACSLIRALGGDFSNSSEFMSKSAIKHKKEFSFHYGDKSPLDNLSSTPIYLEKLPGVFKEKLKQISRAVRKIEDISSYITESYCATIFEALISVLENRIPKQCVKLITDLSSNLLTIKNENGVPYAFLQRNCSFVVEKMFQAANEDIQLSLWNEYLIESLETLVIHSIGNYIVQRLFDVVKSQSLFQAMCERTCKFFGKILEAEHYGIFVSIAAACNRLKNHQALFMKNIMLCLNCAEPQERQLKLIPLVLGFKKYDDADFLKSSSKWSICLQGSLLVQSMIAFQKPIRLVNSLLSCKSTELYFLACHIQGCHVLTAFFKSETVGEKNKDKCIQCLQPSVISVACDVNGNLTLARLWKLLSLKQKGVIANILAQHEEELKTNRNGNILFNKFKVFQFKRNYEKWKEEQQNFLNVS